MKTMNVPAEHERQTDIRLALLANGYRPLPTAEKVAFMKGWPEMPVTEQAIRSWPLMALGMRPAVTTAIQLTGNLLAIDVDVNDIGVANQIEDLMYEVFGEAVTLGMPIRTSGGAKFMVLLRTETPYGMWKTPKYRDANGSDHMIEVYGAASTRYFSCFGPHTLGSIHNREYEVVKEYVWADGPTPLDTRPEELPLITKEQLNAFLMKADDLIAGAGWEKVQGTKGGEFEAGVAYDLEEGMVFETASGALDYQQAIGYASSERDARCSSSFLGDGSHNTSKCRMKAVGGYDEPALMVFDHETWTTHYPKSWAPRTAADRAATAAQLGEALRRTMPEEVEKALREAAEQGADVEAFEAAVDFLIENLAYDVVTGAVHYLDSRTLIWSHVSMSTVKGAYAHLDLSWEGPKGGRRRYSAVDAWRAYDDKIKVAGVRFRPGAGRVFLDDGQSYANGFFGLSAAGGHDDALGLLLSDFLVHLVPDAEERSWLMDWMATKYQKPWERNCAVLFVAPGVQGAGRGTLFRMLDTAFDGYTSTVRESDLLGGRFNGFLEQNLLVFCNELGGMGWHDRKKGYETLKDIVDPSHDSAWIERKGLEAYRTKTYSSFMLATNNPGALTMDAEDRRFAIITNGDKLEGELLERMLDAGIDNLAGQLKLTLQSWTVTRGVSDAPAFGGREHMLTANETDLDEAIREVIDSAAPWRSWVRSDFEKSVKLVARGSTSATVPGLRQAVSQLVGRRAERMGAELLPNKVRLPSSAVSVVSKNPGYLMAASPEGRAKICRGVEPGADDTNVVALKT